MVYGRYENEWKTDIEGLPSNVFCCLGLTIVSVVLSKNVGIKDVARGLMPFWGRALWFVSAYITLAVFTPFLNRIISWDKGIVKKLLVLFFLSVSIVSSLPERQDAYLCDSMWFLVVYLFVGYVKKYKIKACFSGDFVNLCFGIGAYIALIFPIYCRNIFPSSGMIGGVANLCGQYLGDIKTIPNILIAWLIFSYAKNRRHFSNKIVNRFATLSFPAYIFHQVPAFYPVLWNVIMSVHDANVFYVFIVFAGISFVVGLIELFRVKAVEPVFFLNTKILLRFTRTIDLFLNCSEISDP